jgi:hypothetical protein
MIRAQFHRIRKTEAWRWSMLVLGALLLIAIIPVGPLPGPGGIFLFAAGMALILRNSAWARRRYVWAKKRWPRLGHYSDMSLRRRSHRQRVARRREREARAARDAIDAIEASD